MIESKEAYTVFFMIRADVCRMSVCMFVRELFPHSTKIDRDIFKI